MTLKEYINTHPEQFKDDIDKWLFLKFGIIGGCCSAEKSHEYNIARMVAEKLTDAFIEKATWWLSKHFYDEEYQSIDDEGTWIDADELIEDFKKYMED